MGTMTADFAGDVAIVTGAAGGMGRAIALAFARAGAAVAMADVDQAGGEETARLVDELGAASIFLPTDVTDDDAVRSLVETTASRLGAVGMAVNAAAIENETGPLGETSVEAFDRMQAVNVRGLYSCMRHEIAAMLGNDRPTGAKGAIVNIASTNSFRPQHDQPAYTASKHAVIGLTRSAAIDYAGKGIRINAICPGSIDTPMLRGAIERRGRDAADVARRLSLLGRFGTPDEIADAALWLCSDAASYVVGHALAVDAGYLAR